MCVCVCTCECMHKLTQLDSATRLMSDWLMDRQQQMEGWRCVLMGCGALSVMTDGTPEMLKLSADNLDLMDVSSTNVSFNHAVHIALFYNMFFIIITTPKIVIIL